MSPPSGVELSTVFSLSMIGWIDDPSKMPLVYHFWEVGSPSNPPQHSSLYPATHLPHAFLPRPHPSLSLSPRPTSAQLTLLGNPPATRLSTPPPPLSISFASPRPTSAQLTLDLRVHGMAF